MPSTKGLGSTQFLHRPGGIKLAYERVAPPCAPASASTACKPALLFCNGIKSTRGGNKVQFLKQLAYDHGLEFVAFDYRGHGESSGDFLRLGVSDWLADTQAIMRDVVQSTNLVIVGTSLGGWIACLAVAAQQQQEPKQWQQQQQQQQEQGPAICRLLLINPAIDISETWWQGMSSAEQQQVLASGVACLRSAYLEPGEEQLVGLSFFEQGRRHLLLQGSHHPKPVCQSRAAEALHGPHPGAGVANSSSSNDSNLGTARSLRGLSEAPIVILHGNADDVVPVDTSLRLMYALAGSSPVAEHDGASSGDASSVVTGLSVRALGRVELKVVHGGDHRLSEPAHLELLGAEVLRAVNE